MCSSASWYISTPCFTYDLLCLCVGVWVCGGGGVGGGGGGGGGGGAPQAGANTATGHSSTDCVRRACKGPRRAPHNRKQPPTSVPGAAAQPQHPPGRLPPGCVSPARHCLHHARCIHGHVEKVGLLRVHVVHVCVCTCVGVVCCGVLGAHAAGWCAHPSCTQAVQATRRCSTLPARHHMKENLPRGPASCGGSAAAARAGGSPEGTATRCRLRAFGFHARQRQQVAHS
jgi:hypothetical protein